MCGLWAGTPSRDEAVLKTQAKGPIQLDIVLVCHKTNHREQRQTPTAMEALESAREKLRRLRAAGLQLSRNDRKIVLFGQILTTLKSASDARCTADLIERELATLEYIYFERASEAELEYSALFSAARPRRDRALRAKAS